MFEFSFFGKILITFYFLFERLIIDWSLQIKCRTAQHCASTSAYLFFCLW